MARHDRRAPTPRQGNALVACHTLARGVDDVLVHVPMPLATKPAPFGPDLRTALIAMVRKRVPESEVEDIVQQALAEAIESPHAPEDSESLRRWIFGVAKHKVVDYHRRAGRESFELPDVEGTPAPHVEADLLRWAERNLPEGVENKKTLDWMLREGEGEKLESIAASEKLPPPRVRQRVSRLRRHFKENWQREVALLAALGVIVSVLVLIVTKTNGPEPITHDVVDPRAEPMRRLALEKCASDDWTPCLEGLDEARRLDPAGDARPDVQSARRAAAKALSAPPPVPNDIAPTPAPSTPPPSPSDISPSPQSSAPPPKIAPPKPAPSVDATAPRPVPTPTLPNANQVPLSKANAFPPDGKTAPKPQSKAVKPAAPTKKAGASKSGGAGSSL
jgi:DNA-directed RNA polymerase specialized sigma24 family protein